MGKWDMCMFGWLILKIKPKFGDRIVRLVIVVILRQVMLCVCVCIHTHMYYDP